ncbi:olfactory receptor 5V1-like [Engystomops pustulosus]|uniref:olfactory receptor 5V1-like n=1 Tax=Engystomops pustulosus TaxID=76066 RepID=UPI003AFADF2F
MPMIDLHQKNYTLLENVLLLNLSDGWFFVTILFFVIYCTILIGNISIFTIIRVETHLHSPMYFFLSNLSLLDILYSSATIPLMLFNCITGKTKISFRKCIFQLYFFVSLGGAECILLAIMAYDRFVAICNPLRYPVVMSSRACASLAVTSWLSGFINSVLHTVMTANLKFCQSDANINHFYCDVPPLIQASCNPTKTSKILLYVVSIFLGFTPFMYIVISYVHIISTIMKIKSSEGRWRAFSTCSSHLIVVTIFYGTANLNYVGPTGYSLELENLASLLYCILTPLVNPIIYCLRNKEVKGAFKKYFRHNYFTVSR